VQKLKAGLADAMSAGAAPAILLKLLRDDSPPADADLPDTGVGLTMERVLGPCFIRTPVYGTRASTVLRVGRQRVEFVEQSFVQGEPGEYVEFSFELDVEPPLPPGEGWGEGK